MICLISPVLGLTLNDSLVRAWPLANTTDYTGNSTLATAGMSYISGIKDNAANTAGNKYFYDAYPLSDSQIAHNYTLSAWINMAGCYTTGLCLIYSQMSIDGNHLFSIGVDVTSCYLHLQNYESGYMNIVYSASLCNSSWNSVIIRRTNNLIDFYVNGENVVSTPCTSVGCNVTLTTEVNIGARTYSATDYYLNGKVDELYIWDRALDNTEISQISQNQTSAFYPFSGSLAPATPANLTNITLPLEYDPTGKDRQKENIIRLSANPGTNYYNYTYVNITNITNITIINVTNITNITVINVTNVTNINITGGGLANGSIGDVQFNLGNGSLSSSSNFNYDSGRGYLYSPLIGSSGISVTNISNLGSEIIINGTFQNNISPFYDGTCFRYWDSVNFAVAKSCGISGTLIYDLNGSSMLTIGNYYLLNFTLFNNNNTINMTPSVAGNTFSQILSNVTGQYIYVFKALNNNRLQFVASASTRFEITNISIKQILGGNLDVIGNITASNIVTIGSANKTLSYCGNITGSNVNLCNISGSSASNPFPIFQDQYINTTNSVSFLHVNTTSLNISGNGGISSLYTASIFGLRANIWDLNSAWTWVRNSSSTIFDNTLGGSNIYVGNFSYGATHTYMNINCDSQIALLAGQNVCLFNVSSTDSVSPTVFNQAYVQVTSEDYDRIIALTDDTFNTAFVMTHRQSDGSMEILQFKNGFDNPMYWNFIVAPIFDGLRNVKITSADGSYGYGSDYRQKVVCYDDNAMLGHCESLQDPIDYTCDCQPNEAT